MFELFIVVFILVADEVCNHFWSVIVWLSL